MLHRVWIIEHYLGGMWHKVLASKEYQTRKDAIAGRDWLAILHSDRSYRVVSKLSEKP